MKRPSRKNKRRASNTSPSHTQANDAVATIVQLHQAGQIEEAKRLCQRWFEIDAANATLAHLLGRLQFETGEQDRAAKNLAKAAKLRPGDAAIENDLGNVLAECGRKEEATDAYKRAIQADPENIQALRNLGLLLKNSGHYANAIDTFRKAVRINDKSVELICDLANALSSTGEIEEATRQFSRAIELNPSHVPAYADWCGMLRQHGRFSEAATVLGKWLEQIPNDPIAQHLLAASSGHATPDRASDEYVREVFDRFAATFDEELCQLDYQTPRLLGELLQEIVGEPTGNLLILDAGCGTGMCGPELRKFADRLTGVDLSSEMVKQAEKRQLYDELVVGELSEFIRKSEDEFDLIVSADTLNYFGDLAEVFKAAHRALAKGGYLVFSLEKSDREEQVVRYQLNENGRYAHNRTYFEATLTDSAFEVCTVREVALRKEAGADVKGYLVAAKSIG